MTIKDSGKMGHPLDLEGNLRPGLDLLTHEIVISLKKRSRYRQNPEIYMPGLVLERQDISLLDYELYRLEEVHAELGRFTYADQESFTDQRGTKLVIKRQAPESPVLPVRSNLGEKVKARYLEWVCEYCPAGSDSDTYGETVTADVAALMNLFERITLGKYVAESKFEKGPERFIQTGGDSDKIKELIVHPEREARVLDTAAEVARRYEFDPEQARQIYRWVIQLTVENQVRYLRRRMDLP
jgi:chorismate mutase